jgi:hypothetical protein
MYGFKKPPGCGSLPVVAVDGNTLIQFEHESGGARREIRGRKLILQLVRDVAQLRGQFAGVIVGGVTSPQKKS